MRRTAPTEAGPNRLAWLDALRALAVLLVLWEHFCSGTPILHGVRDVTLPWIKTGDVGVFLFFLVSGYIIPASLERRGSVRGFWISRLFRLYPLWAVVLVAAALLRHYDRFTPDPYAAQHPATSLLAHATMLQDFLGVQDSVWVMWSLSYEMAFYLLATALFVNGLHRRSSEVALALACGSLLLTPILPIGHAWTALGVGRTTALVVILFTVGIAASVSGRARPTAIGATGLGVVSVVLITRDGFVPGWEGLLVLATMFIGTAVRRVHTGQTSGRRVAGYAGAVLALAVLIATWNAVLARGSHVDGAQFRRYVLALLTAGALFGCGLLLRERRVPRALTTIGEISFSVYLVHPLLLKAFQQPLTDWGNEHTDAMAWERLAAFGGFVVLVVACAAVTYRCIELPAQNLGRRFGVWCEAQLGSDAHAGRRSRNHAMSAA